jgi:ABC-type cobalamin/Fe3+-siderophores transport system ATPase subunit
MNKPIITLDNLAIGYNRQPVLSGISLSIARGSFTAILGANGSGKSTLLKTLIGKFKSRRLPYLVTCRKQFNLTRSFC